MNLGNDSYDNTMGYDKKDKKTRIKVKINRNIDEKRKKKRKKRKKRRKRRYSGVYYPYGGLQDTFNGGSGGDVGGDGGGGE